MDSHCALVPRPRKYCPKWLFKNLAVCGWLTVPELIAVFFCLQLHSSNMTIVYIFNVFVTFTLA